MAYGSEILEQQVIALKHDLKLWEKAFASQHDGKRPGKEDIRRDATISAKYREYDRLRRPTSFAEPVATPRKERQIRPGSAHKRTALRDRGGNAITRTPNKAAKSTTLLEVVEEEQEVAATPAFIRCALGPTPQKDGQVLGIFDMPTATPSKSSLLSTVPEFPTVSGTPSKPSAVPPPSQPVPSATPQSSSKRRLFAAFTGTPLKRKREDDGHTPTSAKRQFATPSFLRRAFPLASIDEESAVGAPPFKKRGLVRSLSSIIQGLRKQEDKRMDDEWDIMNELEAEEHGEAPQPKAPKVLVEDSQAAEMPLGPDQGPQESDEEGQSIVQPAVDANGKPRKPWKKKGLKRQTKRTNMRPVLHKPKKAGDLAANEGSDDDVVAETQQTDAPSLRVQQSRQGDDQDNSGASGDDDAASEYEEETAEAGEKISGAPVADKKRLHLGETAKRREPGDKATKVEKGKDQDAVAKPATAPKKVSAQAHANYRALKIKNKNSKAGGKGGRRFGRR